MVKKAWIINLKFDINKIDLFCLELNKYILFLNQRNDNPSRVYSSIIKQFNDSLSAFTLLLNSNYEKYNELTTSKINNTSGIYIFIRKMIEANMVLNIILNNGGKLYESYLSQSSFDESHISKMFGESCRHFKMDKESSVDKYDWLSKEFDKKIVSVDDLIDIARLDLGAKTKIKTWVRECNYMSHPTLYSDDKIISQITGNFITEIHDIFDIIMEMILVFYQMIELIEQSKYYLTEYNLTNLKTHIPHLIILNKKYNELDESHKSSYVEFNKIDFNQIPYNIRAEFSMINLFLSAPLVDNMLGTRQKRTLGKLIDILAEDLRDLLIGYYHQNYLVFYTKIRQVLEDLAYVDCAMKMSDIETEIFQCYTDIQRYINASYMTLWTNKMNDTKLDFKKITIKVNSQDITIEDYYYKNINFFKDYILSEYKIKVKSNFIKRPNSWAFNGDKIPSNWQLIKNMLLNIESLSPEKMKYYNGLYSLSSTFCHVNEFSIINKTVYKDNVRAEMLREVMIVVKNVFEKLLNYIPLEMQSLIPKNNQSINKLLYNLYNYDIINIPNPN